MQGLALLALKEYQMKRFQCLSFLLFIVFLLSCSAAFAQVSHYLHYVSQTPDTLYLELAVHIASQPMPGYSISNYLIYPWWGVAVNGAAPDWPHESGTYSFAYHFGSSYTFPIAWPITVEEGLYTFQAYVCNQTNFQSAIAVGEPISIPITDQYHSLVNWDLDVVAANHLGLNLRLMIYNPTPYTWSMTWPNQPIACFSINNQMIMGQEIDEPITISVGPGQFSYIPIPYAHNMSPGVYRLQAYLISPYDGELIPLGGMETVTLGNVQNLEYGDGDIAGNQPIDFYWPNSLYECIYTSEELGGIHGQITSLALYNSFSGDGINDVPLKVYLGNTYENHLFDGWIPSDQLSLVYDGELDFPEGSAEILFNLDTPFTLNQGQNLVMMVQRQGGEGQQTGKLFLCQESDGMNGRLATTNTTPLDSANPPATAAFTGKTPKLGIWYIPGVDNMDELAPSLQSARVYPNPFSEASSLEFTLKHAGYQEIAVYNLKGQLVKTLFAGFRQAGDYSVSWNGRDERGEQVANGIYFYRIKSAKGQNSHKTILIR